VVSDIFRASGKFISRHNSFGIYRTTFKREFGLVDIQNYRCYSIISVCEKTSRRGK